MRGNCPKSTTKRDGHSYALAAVGRLAVLLVIVAAGLATGVRGAYAADGDAGGARRPQRRMAEQSRPEAPAAGKQASRPRPNVLIAFADDWGCYASAYARYRGGACSVVKTPHFDRVAREGVLFLNAFVAAPSCTPCRSALLSGQYWWRTGLGAILQGAVWDASIPAFPLLLESDGYHIGFTYKVWGPGTPANAPYGGSRNAYHSGGTRFNGFSQFVSRAGKDAKAIQRAKEQLLAEVETNFRSFLARRRPGQPFCYWFGPTNVHRKWVKGSGKRLWGIDPDRLKGKLPAFLPDVPAVREDFADYLGEVQAFDAGLGRILAVLEETGEADNTLVIVSGDHGAPGFPRGKCNLYDFGVHVPLAIRWPRRVPGGRVVEDFVNLPDLAPTILQAAGQTPPSEMTGKSLLPVLEQDKQGQVDPSRTFVVVGRERHVAAARPGFLPYPHRAIRTAQFAYIVNFKPERWPMGIGPGFGAPPEPVPSFQQLENNTFVAFADLDASPTKAWIFTHRSDPGMDAFVQFAFGRRPAEELYDLRNDPDEMKNLASDPRYDSIRKRLRSQLFEVLTETGDPRVIGDGDTYDKPPFAGPLPKTPRKSGGPRPGRGNSSRMSR